MRKFSLLIVMAALLMAVISPAASFAQDKPTATIADIVVTSSTAAKPEFTILLAAVKAADPMFLAKLSDKESNMTVFAPTDAAFGDLLKALNMKAEDLLKNTALLDTVLAYHVVPGVALDAKTVIAAKGAVVGTALPEHVLAIDVVDGKVKINDATVVTADVAAANGVVHVIDKVLVPADAMDVAKAMESMMAETADPSAAKPVSIAETVVAASKASPAEFSTLLAAVSAADPAVLKTLSADGSYTVFAPTDAAFGAALKALNVTAEQLLANKDLTNILLYHVVPGEISSTTLVAAIGTTGVKVVTLSGGLLSFNVKDGKVVINDNSTVVATDVKASNGIIHVIDGVLLPPAM